MKKILSLIGAVTLVATSSSSVVSCNSIKYSDLKLPTNEELKIKDFSYSNIIESISNANSFNWISDKLKQDDNENNYYFITDDNEKIAFKQIINKDNLEIDLSQFDDIENANIDYSKYEVILVNKIKTDEKDKQDVSLDVYNLKKKNKKKFKVIKNPLINLTFTLDK